MRSVKHSFKQYLARVVELLNSNSVGPMENPDFVLVVLNSLSVTIDCDDHATVASLGLFQSLKKLLTTCRLAAGQKRSRESTFPSAKSTGPSSLDEGSCMLYVWGNFKLISVKSYLLRLWLTVWAFVCCPRPDIWIHLWCLTCINHQLVWCWDAQSVALVYFFVCFSDCVNRNSLTLFSYIFYL